jgi:hypothetical protein
MILFDQMFLKTFFMVNGGDFTGCLLGYFPISSLEPERYFELHFVGGKLNDTIRVYGTWGLELEEVYSNGERLEVLYKTEEMDGMGKPVIYLYPETEMFVNVQLDLNGKNYTQLSKISNQWLECKSSARWNSSRRNRKRILCTFLGGNFTARIYLHGWFCSEGF